MHIQINPFKFPFFSKFLLILEIFRRQKPTNKFIKNSNRSCHSHSLIIRYSIEIVQCSIWSSVLILAQMNFRTAATIWSSVWFIHHSTFIHVICNMTDFVLASLVKWFRTWISHFHWCHGTIHACCFIFIMNKNKPSFIFLYE